MKKAILMFLITPVFCFGINLNMTQIDTSELLLSQEVDVYFSATDDRGKTIRDLTIDQIAIAESFDGHQYSDPKVPQELTRMSDLDRGIQFFFLIDNSGSMYEGESPLPAEQASKALINFSGSMSNPNDTLGVASFNTFYNLLLPGGSKDRQLGFILDGLTKPEPDAAYTELFFGIEAAAKELAELRGRKVLVVLSDGENFSYYQRLGKEHPVHGQNIGTPELALAPLEQEGISLFAINYGGSADPTLKDLAIKSGGTNYSANNQAELQQVYQDIRNRILNEYVASIEVSMPKEEKQFLKLFLNYGNQEARGSRYFFSKNLMGDSRFDTPLYLLLLFPLAALFLVLIGLIPWEKEAQQAGLEVLDPHGTKVSTSTLALTEQRTVIGASTQANLTIAGSSEVEDDHATVVFDDKSGAYTLVSKTEVMVNNNPVTNRKLNPGDVINIGGATIVFDEPVKK